LGGFCALAASCFAQPANLTPVEQGVGDVDPMRTSLRAPAGSTQQDTDFEQVYQGPDGKLYRIAGALYAEFDRSIYVPTAWGAAPVIPPGTVFHIGTPPSLRETPVSASASAHRPARISERLDERVSSVDLRAVLPTRARTGPMQRPTDHGTMSDEATRCARLAQIAARGRTKHL
jgi:hypothetical protein